MYGILMAKMSAKHFLFVFFLGLHGLTVCAQSPPKSRVLQRTWGQLNGRAWRTFSEEGKLAYLEGVTSAFGTAYQRALHTPCENQTALLLDAYREVGFTEGETMASLDHFYEEPANLLIGIVDAVEIAAAKARGVPQEVIDSRVADHRCVANEAPERK